MIKHIGIVASLLLINLCGCSAAVKYTEYDQATATYVLDIIPNALWIYQDESLPLSRQFSCYQKGDGTNMKRPEGNYVVEYRIARNGDEPITIKSTGPFAECFRSADLTIPASDGARPKPGRYSISVSMALPSGEHIAGGFTRHFEIRQKEFQVFLHSDKKNYKQGEKIVMTCSILNIGGKAIDFRKLDIPEIMISVGNEYGPSIAITASELPEQLQQDARLDLFTLKFQDGLPDKRFSPGFGSLQIPPFGGKGEYIVLCRVKIRRSDAGIEKRHEWRAKPWMSGQAKVTFLIGSDNSTQPVDER